jgi:L-threonylcarbamoyladenylate synthase
MTIKTKVINIDDKNPEINKIKAAAEIIRNGDVVAFPTETVYGLGANALDENAIRKIYTAKGRPSDNPLIVHVSSRNDVKKLVKKIPENAKKLMNKFWPGPLTIIFRKSDIVPDITTGNLDTVAVRMPDNKIALALIKESRVPIAAPSANISGKPSPTCAKHVINDMTGKIPMILSGGQCAIGLESTVIDMSSKVPILLRPGKISLEELKKVLGKVHVSASVYGTKRKLKKVSSPGMKYKHYSPDAKVIVVRGSKLKVEQKIKDIILSSKKSKQKIAVIGFHKYDSAVNYICRDSTDMAHIVFDKFREADERKIDIIIVEGVNTKGIGLALMNRIKRAASEVVDV